MVQKIVFFSDFIGIWYTKPTQYDIWVCLKMRCAPHAPHGYFDVENDDKNYDIWRLPWHLEDTLFSDEPKWVSTKTKPLLDMYTDMGIPIYCRASHTGDAIRVMYSSVSVGVVHVLCALRVRAGAEHSVMFLSYRSL